MKDSGTERAIFEAALEEFAEKGFHGARMQTIADRAGANKALVHYYFRSKEQLYLKALGEITRAFWDNVEMPMRSLAPGDIFGLARIIATFVVEETQKAPYSRILLTELSTGGRYLKKMDALLAEALESSQRSILTFLQDAIDNGHVKPFHPMKIFNNIMGMCWNIFLSEPYAAVVYEKMGTEMDAAFYDEYIELIAQTVATGLKKDTQALKAPSPSS